MVNIFRVELPIGERTFGPYIAEVRSTDDTVIGACRHFKFNSALMPEPEEDLGISFIPSTYVCGTMSLDLVFEWFPRWSLVDLLKVGFRLAEYQVNEEDVIIGELQCIFHPGRAKLLRTLNVDEAIETIMTSKGLSD